MTGSSSSGTLEMDTVRADPEAARQWLSHFLVMVLEVFDHRRPATQLRAMVSARLLSALVTRSLRAHGCHRLHSVHTCWCAEDVVEFCATVWVTPQSGPARAMALAGRMEHQRKGWITTELRPPGNW
ncbi:hypothetical protein GPX89_25665 [Nocardia sp. ET3-3]|uniref:Uncharacterized protein n=1 Tax=Nocardia terrae TaxID=2675851 RepID=A0A7K1V1Z0_9NOCA|nr:Rv3235 family protein [Nocardia terrae]MVU80625.1 hypothetical protein [Nocardia terrae]